MFVLLEHTTHDGVHWDFIIEVPGRKLLPTWRLLHNPLEATGDIPAEPIADHPPHFLDYEGPVREGLGSVQRLDRGAATVLDFDARNLRVELSGEHLRGVIEITGSPDGRARFRILDRRTSTEGTCFDTGSSITSYTDMPNSTSPTLAIAFLNFTDGCDLAEVEINVTVPGGEASGAKSSTVEFTGSQA